MATSPSRRRQRSTRVTAATSLLVGATVFAIAAFRDGSLVWLASSSMISLVCGWAAARMTHSELRAARRTAAADRAEVARAYRDQFDERVAEHARFTSALTGQLVLRERELGELNATLVLSERRAELAEQKTRREILVSAEAIARVNELEAQLGEPLSAATNAAESDDLETVVDLLRWEEKVTASRPGAIRAV
jgi:hypothetical protein